MTSSTDSPQHTVLYVDDEAQALKYFTKAYAKDFNILTATSVDEALRILTDQADDIAILVTDQRMPKQSGTDLLKRVRQDHPHIVRILTTAYSDLESAIEAVNTGEIFRYVTKPWDIRDLRGVLLRALDFYQIQQERDQLLVEKLSVLQRMLLLDRARSLVILAGSIQPQVRHALHALRSYLAIAAMRPTDNAKQYAAGWEDLWGLTLDEAEQILNLAGRVNTAAQGQGWSDLALADLIRAAHGEPAGSAAGATVKADSPLLARALTILLNRSQHDRRVDLAEEPDVHGAPGVRLSLPTTVDNLPLVTDATPTLSDDAADILVAFFLIHHHAGRVTAAADGKLLIDLPRDPEQAKPAALDPHWMEDALAFLEV